MGQLVRTITFGLNIDADAPEKSSARIERFLTRCPDLLDKHGLAARCLRLTCQPQQNMYQSQDGPVRAQAFARAMEAVPAVLGATRNVFTHTLISSPSGVHRGAIRKAGEVIARLARLNENSQAN